MITLTNGGTTEVNIHQKVMIICEISEKSSNHARKVNNMSWLDFGEDRFGRFTVPERCKRRMRHACVVLNVCFEEAVSTNERLARLVGDVGARTDTIHRCFHCWGYPHTIRGSIQGITLRWMKVLHHLHPLLSAPGSSC